MYASPVAYSSTLVPERFRFLYEINPLFWVVEGFRWALLGKDFQLGLSFLVSLALTVLGLFFGAMAFRRAERTIVDIL
jgi:lipopolysaccharide transport system permease protein